MKQYVVTSKHPELKEGIIIEFERDKWSSFDGWVYIKDNDLRVSVENGYIKEVEEKEFTKSDMIDFVQFYADDLRSNIMFYKEEFERFINNRNNE